MVLVVALAALLALAACVPLFDRGLGRNTGYPLAAGFVGIGLLLTWPAPWGEDAEIVSVSWSWLPSLGISATLRLDGLGALFALLVLGVGALIMAYCPRYLKEKGNHATVYSLLTLFAAAMLGLVMAADVVLLLVFWELTTICSFFLIASAGPKAVKPAVKAFLVTAAGGLALLAAVVMLAVTAGTTDLTAILAAPEVVLASPLAWPIGALIVFAAFTKSAQFPFHSWLPGAMAAITPVSAYLHAATMVKAGIYLLMRFSPMFSAQTAWQATLVTVGLFSAVFGAVWALRQHDLKLLLAYSTVSQLGLLVAAIGVGTATALSAAILHTFAHALFKATLFMLVGVIDREAGSRDIRELSGLRRVMPATAMMTGLAGLSMAGVPPLLGFVSKEYLFQGFLGMDVTPWAGPLATTVAVGASALTFAYGMRIFYGAFGGPTVQRGLYEPAFLFLAPAAVSAVAGLALGPGVPALNGVVGPAVLAVQPTAYMPHFELWHGFAPELWMSVATIAIGMALFLSQARVEEVFRLLPRSRPVFDKGYDGLLRLGAAVGRPDRSDITGSYLVRPVAALVLLAGVGAVALYGHPASGPETVTPLDWPVLLVLAVVVAGAMLTGSALAALALLGLTGLVLTVWFMLAGAPDVAMTLLLVEVLTAVAAVLVLTRLPARFRRPRPFRAAGAGFLALAAGAGAAGATLLFTGDRDISPVGAYFLREAEEDTGGRNVVNTILVDFRGLDTLGEAVVLGTVALGLLTLLGARNAPGTGRPLAPVDGLILQMTNRMLVPAMLLLSAYLFARGHYQPGGGFISALVAGAVIAYGYLAYGRVPGSRSRWLRPTPLVIAGTVLSVGVALSSTFVGDAFFAPQKTTLQLPGDVSLSLTTSLIFDLGVYLFVTGLVLAAIDRLGDGLPADAVPPPSTPPPAPPPSPPTAPAPAPPGQPAKGGTP
ncbi:monovalent cation/H+ antiporter subunit A [Streptomyces sodiiphilus]|uniref:Monovalent cation/H+ antiporter subunit A n=1 Tax=Streptomyces sodiiphilus TaxID=226217 RepID=A0ABN2NTM7_9ACTN